MTAARILAFRIPDAPPLPGRESPVAILTVEIGPLVVAGLCLHVGDDGSLRLSSPKMRAGRDRVVLRAGPERDAILRHAENILAGIVKTRTAASPLATAPDTTEHCA